MFMHLKYEDADIIRQLRQSWSSGLASFKWTQGVYLQVRRTILASVAFQPQPRQPEIHAAMRSPRSPPAQPARLQKLAQKRRNAAIQLVRQRLKLKNNLKALNIPQGQLNYIRRLLRSEEGCMQLMNPSRPGRRRKVTEEHVTAIQQISAGFGVKKFTGRQIS